MVREMRLEAETQFEPSAVFVIASGIPLMFVSRFWLAPFDSLN